MKLDPRFLTHVSKGEHITVSTSGTKFNGLIRSNPTAAFIVELLKKDTTHAEIVDKMLAKYDVDRATAEKDSAALIKKLREIGAVID
ncbi:MAG: PqqD family protein [Ruminococcus sp.]|nr:PqqD family protein [Ruminococcus sp.]